MEEIYLGTFHGHSLVLKVPKELTHDRDWAYMWHEWFEKQKKDAVNDYLESL